MQSWGTQLVSLLVILVLARLLEPEAFGLLAMALAFVSVVQLFVDQGMGEALVQRSSLEPAHTHTAFWAAVLSGCALMLVALVLAGPVAALFGEPQLSSLIRWLSPVFIFGGITTVPLALLRRQLAFHTIARRSLASVLPGGLVGIAMAASGFGVWSLVAQSLTSSFLLTALVWTASGFVPGRQFSWRHLRELITFGGTLTVTYGVNLLNRRADDVIIGYFLGPAALGYYAVAYQILLSLMQLLTGVTASAVLPVFSRLQEDPERLRSAFFSVTKFTSLLAFPAFTGLAVLAPDLLLMLFGAAWLPSGSVLRLLAFIGILHSVFYFNATVFVAVGKPILRLYVTLVNAVVNVAAFLVAVRWGIVGVAAAYVACGYLLAPLPLRLLSRLLAFRYRTYLRLYTTAVVGSVAVAIIAAASRNILMNVAGLHATVALSILLGGAVYAMVIHRIEPGLIQQYVMLARTAVSPVPTGKS